jgi:glutamine cyclotransferase
MKRPQKQTIQLLVVGGLALALLLLSMVGRQFDARGRPAVQPTETWVPTLTLTVEPAPTDTVATVIAEPLVSPLDSPLVSPIPLASWPTITPSHTYRVVRVYPHDPGAFTQGLVYHQGYLYEGTGLRGRSSLRRVVLETGQVVESVSVEDRFFGEGITILGDRLYQLTWQSNVGFIYEWQDLTQLDQFTYPTEGWGLTHDGTWLIMSDGTATLYFLDPHTMRQVRQVTVQDRGNPVRRLNELEYVDGEIYANVWQQDLIVRIDPRDGTVLGWIDMSGLLNDSCCEQPVDVLNGIAYDAEGDRLFVTGKLWPKLFEIAIVPKND